MPIGFMAAVPLPFSSPPPTFQPSPSPYLLYHPSIPLMYTLPLFLFIPAPSTPPLPLLPLSLHPLLYLRHPFSIPPFTICTYARFPSMLAVPRKSAQLPHPFHTYPILLKTIHYPTTPVPVLFCFSATKIYSPHSLALHRWLPLACPALCSI